MEEKEELVTTGSSSQEMKIGLLWFDNDKESSLETKVNRAAKYYAGKYGYPPVNCYVNDSLETPYMIGDIHIFKTKSVLPNHFWLGQ